MPKPSNRLKIYLSMSILLLSSGVLYFDLLFHDKSTEIESKLFPEIAGWSSRKVDYDPVVQTILSPDRIVYNLYNKEDKLQITLFIAYYATLEKADKSHSPEVCFTGQGWKINENNTVKVSLDVDQKKSFASVNEIVQVQSGKRMVVFYWFQNTYGTITNRGLQKLVLFGNRLLGKSDSNAFVRLTTMVPPDMEITEASSQLKSFLQKLQPVLEEYIK